MRKLSLQPLPEAGAQIEAGLDYWASLSAASPDYAHQQVVIDNAQLVVSLAQHYQQQGCSQQELLDAAYHALLQHLQKTPSALTERFLAYNLRQAMLAVLGTKR